MFRWIVASSLQLRFLVAGIAAALVVFGGLQLRTMPVDVFPEFAPPTVEVQTEAVGLSATEVESLITLNLEELLSGVPWLQSIRSQSVIGLSSIVLIFQPGTDLMKARQMIQERLTLAYTLPNVSKPPVMLQPLSATSRFMMIGLSSASVEPTELSLLARWTIKPKLAGVPGVANVAIWGQRLRQLQVHIDPERLREARLGQEDVIAAAGDSFWVSPLSFLKGSAPVTGGWIDNPNQRLGVQHQMPIASPEELAGVPIGAPHLLLGGKAMALGEVAEVTFAHPPLIGDAHVNGGAGLLLVLEKFPGANTLEVTRGVEQALAELRRGLPGVQVDASLYRLASYIEDSFLNLARAMLIGAALVFLVVGLFLSSWRVALASFASIALVLLAALVALHLTGATINTMIIAGLALAAGLVIDEAVVDAHRVRERLRERGPGDSVARLVYESTLDTRRAALYATLILALAVTPVFFMGGVSGAFFEPLARAYLLAALCSMAVALTVAPGLSLMLLAKAPGVAERPAVARLHARYEAALRRVVAVPGAVLAAAAAAVAAALLAWPFLGQALLPSLNERELLVNLTTAPGTSYEETYRLVSRLSRELRAIPGVLNTGAHVGRAVTGDQVVGVNSAQIWMSIDSRADRRKTGAAIRETLDGYPGAERSLQSYLRDKVSEALTGATSPIVVRLYGPKREVLLQKAEEVRRALAGVPGLLDLRTETQAEEPQVHVKVDLAAAGRAGVKPGDIRRASATVFSGLTVGYLFEDQKILDVVVWSAPEARRSLSNLRDLWVERADRRHVRLSEVAEVRIASTPASIRHEGISPYVDVVANAEPGDLAAATRAVLARLQAIEFPLEHSPKVLGEHAERLGAQQRMLGMVIAVMIGIFLLLQAFLRSWPLALVAFFALPASFAGGVLAAVAAGGSISLGSIVGFLAVLGIAARNSLSLIEGYQRLAQAGNATDAGLVVRGASQRLLPIVTSAAAIAAALLPIVLFGSVPGLEIVQPAAVVVLGGVLASAAFTLLAAPALYLALSAESKGAPDLGLA
ncbi:MAG: efflux RND transporter permease subunit [Betaproteobacteria bacterium]